jgi:hypothetical protein
MNGWQHHSLASGRWFTLSLCEQLGNIGTEIGRALRSRSDEKRFESAVSRALELFDLTLSDPRWRKRLKEIAIARELFCCAVTGNAQYDTTLEDLDRYFYYFALAARSNR